MEDIQTESVVENKPENTPKNMDGSKQIAGAIIIVGILIAGAILLKGNTGSNQNPGVQAPVIGDITLAPVTASDRILGNLGSKLTLVVYEDFQCPFCERFFKDVEQQLINSYIADGSMSLVYRDFAFLGPESIRSAEAALCAGDQGKFWQYHDYLFEHQNGENKGNFSDTRLKSFIKDVGLDATTFNKCFDSNKYATAIEDSKKEGSTAGVSGTPKSFIITQKDISSKTQAEILKVVTSPTAVSFYKDKKIMSLNGALPYTMVKPIIDILLK